MNQQILENYEQRIRALELQCQTPEEREINKLVIRMVKAIRSTLWLMNGAAKYFAGPAGIVLGVWYFGVNFGEELLKLLTGETKP